MWRIFLNFPLKSLGGKGSRGKLTMRPRTTSSRTSEQSVSLSAISVTALSSKDVSDGREPTATSVILPSETVPVSLFFKNVLFNFSPLFPSVRALSLAEAVPCSEGATRVSFGLLMCFNLCTCQGSSASYSNIHELGRYWITNSAPPLFSQKKARGREERGSQTQTGRKEGKRATTPPPTVCPRGIPE